MSKYCENTTKVFYSKSGGIAPPLLIKILNRFD
jgi:hypothetical protein